LISVGRFKAIDSLRRQARFNQMDNASNTVAGANSDASPEEDECKETR
jgi:predicted RNA polymerase sigma factor